MKTTKCQSGDFIFVKKKKKKHTHTLPCSSPFQTVGFLNWHEFKRPVNMYQRQYKKKKQFCLKKILCSEINSNTWPLFQKALPESAKSCQNQLKSDAVLDSTTGGTHHLHKDKSQAGSWIKYREKRRRKPRRFEFLHILQIYSQSNSEH